MVNTILKEADLFCPNSVRINFTIYHTSKVCLIVWSTGKRLQAGHLN
ncbi:ABC transporter ATP-binding protein (plasmid) [Lactiplantibacillus plantarum]|nr:ABC transporter ATP-binding protein [Lactiplantibacillus plantarum]QAS28406.1 ABC transporter ATP-binding protein [Lactiplantibacillus plantarum]QAS31448.1 ABC transporter ATP-binding protein [Lactiplantibacillus plantarum]RWZ05131.1 ABC transporter ATP-binding protein [Lactiplantibacillus plantarum]RWZ45961.1 ABC transporter ATP-binding protein [Lactiplantibacillus plantarum]